MNVLIIGNENSAQALAEKLPSTWDINYAEILAPMDRGYDIIFDLEWDEEMRGFESYAGLNPKFLFLSSVKQSLAEGLILTEGEFNYSVAGINALPTFIGRDLLEVSCLNTEAQTSIEKLLTEAQLGYRVVIDRVGMVTPRVIFMIINEAYYTVQEGTASKEDIDVGMRLGTNYPMGPFEWSRNIGLQHIYEVLEALYEDTGEERYKICPLLKSEYLAELANMSV